MTSDIERASFSRGVRSRDDEIARLNLRVAKLTSGSEAANLAGRVVEQDREIARLKAEVSDARRHAVGVMADGLNRALDKAGAPAAESPGLRIYAMRDEIARLKAANASPDLGAGVVVPIDYVALGIIQDARDVLAKTFKNGDVYGLIARIDAWFGKAGG